MTDQRTRAQRWADRATEFSGSWAFIWAFAAFSVAWIVANTVGLVRWDSYPFLFLNWLMTLVSTFQSPLILLSQNRQNEVDRERSVVALAELRALRAEFAELRAYLSASCGCRSAPPVSPGRSCPTTPVPPTPPPTP